MVVNLDTTTQYVDKSFPLKVLWEITQITPISSKSFCAVSVLFVFDLSGGIVSIRDGLIYEEQKRKLRPFSKCPLRIHTGRFVDIA